MENKSFQVDTDAASSQVSVRTSVVEEEFSVAPNVSMSSLPNLPNSAQSQDPLKEKAKEVIKTGTDIGNISRQLYLLGQMKETAPPEIIPRYLREDVQFSSRSRLGTDDGQMTQVSGRTMKSGNMSLIPSLLTPFLTRRKGEKERKKFIRNLDRKLVGLSKNVKKSKLKKKARQMAFDGAWRLHDVLELRPQPFRFITVLEWINKLCIMLKKLHAKEISIGRISSAAVFFSRDLELLMFQDDLMRQNTGSSYKSYDILLLGSLFVEMLSSFADVEWNYKNSSLKKVILKEYGLLYTKQTETKKNLEDSALIEATEKEVKECLGKCLINGQKIPRALVDVIVNSCSPARYKRRSASEMVECIEGLLEELRLVLPHDDNLDILTSLLGWNGMELPTIKLNDIHKEKKMIIHSILPVISDSGVFDAGMIDTAKGKEENAKGKQKDDNASLSGYESEDSYMPPNAASTIAKANKHKAETETPIRQIQDFLNSTSDTKELEKQETRSQVEDLSTHVDGRNRSRSLDRGYEAAKNKTKSDLLAEQVVGTDTLHLAKKAWTLRSDVQNIIQGIDPEKLAEKFKLQVRLSSDEAIAIVNKAAALLNDEPNLLNLKGPVNIVGDIHGQYFDLRDMMLKAGMPGVELPNPPVKKKEGEEEEENEDTESETPQTNKRTFLFLGDYVDRGSFSCEVILYLFSLKIKYPENVWLLRGNHESRVVSSFFGFQEECLEKYGIRFFNACVLAFQALPLGATVHTDAGAWLCIHGGISKDVTHLHQFKEVDRFAEPAMNGFLCDILWADPISDELINRYSLAEFMSMEYHINTQRGCSYKYGYRALFQFLQSNNLVGIIRAHEVQQQGYKVHFKTLVGRQANLPLVLTVFSAPNYCGRYGNKAAFLTLQDNCEQGKESPLGKGIYKNARNQARNAMRNAAKRKRSKIARLFNFFWRRRARAVEAAMAEYNRNQQIEQLSMERTLPLDLVYVQQFNAVSSPAPIRFENVHRKEKLNIQNVCPYIPTDFSGFIDKALGLGGHKIPGQSVLLLDDAEPVSVNNPSSPGASSVQKSGKRNRKSAKIGSPNLSNTNRSWKALQILGISEEEENARPVGSINESGGDSDSEQTDEETLRYARAASFDSINELNPVLVDKKLQLAKNSLRESINRLPKGLVVEESKTEQEVETSKSSENETSDAPDENDKVKFSEKEILALKTLFLLIDRTDQGHIDSNDLVQWGLDSETSVTLEDAILCVKFVDYDQDRVIGFQDYLVFAAKCKKAWLRETIDSAAQDITSQTKRNSRH